MWKISEIVDENTVEYMWNLRNVLPTGRTRHG